MLEPPHEIGQSTQDPLLAESVGQLISGLKIRNWDILAVTDGSGQTAATPGGYSALLVMRRTGRYLLFHGQASNCSSQEAEVRGIFEAVNAIVRFGLHKQPTGLRVHLLTDSKQCFVQINKTDPLDVMATKHHPMLWAGIRQATRLGISLTGHHLPRNSNPLMTFMDTVAGANRKAMVAQVADELYGNYEDELIESFPMTIK